ncbi:branched-chain amino acid ABC transporter permease, partial [Aquisalimonas sp.]
MLYRESGQFKTTYAADQAMLPIRQDQIFLALVILVAIAIPFLVSNYVIQALLLPFLIYSVAAIGLNILVGYCGQISLGTGGFMAVGAFAAWNLLARIPEMPPLVAFVLAGLIAAGTGVLFGLPALRIKGFYLAVTTLAAQFFLIWLLQRPWFVGYSPTGVISAQTIEILGWRIDTPVDRYLFALAVVIIIALAAKNLVRSAT